MVQTKETTKKSGKNEKKLKKIDKVLKTRVKTHDESVGEVKNGVVDDHVPDMGINFNDNSDDEGHTGRPERRPSDADNSSLKRKPSLRRKFSALFRGSSDLPAAINRGLLPIRRSLSFNKDLNKVNEKSGKNLRTLGAHWYNSLGSLAEDETRDDDSSLSQEDEFGQKIVSRTDSFLYNKSDWKQQKSNIISLDEPIRNTRKNSITNLEFGGRRRRDSVSVDSSIGRFSYNYDDDSPINNLRRTNCQTCSLPALVDISTNRDESDSPFCRGTSRGGNSWEILRASARNTRVRLGASIITNEDPDYSVRSRSLSQLDMLDAGEHNLSTGASEQSSPQKQLAHHRYQNPQLFASNPVEGSPRLLVPSSVSTDSSHSSNRSRHKLSRSQVPSSEYFSVCFEIGDDISVLDREEFYPAIKGTFLFEALGAACDRRGIDLTRIDVFLDASATPLPLFTTEVSYLGGKHLRVTAKDDRPAASRSASQKSSQNVSSRKAAGSYRRRGSRFFSVSTEDSSLDSEMGASAMLTANRGSGAAGLKASKQRWSGFFTNTKGTKMELLVEQLNSYTKHGVPCLPEIQLPYDLVTNEEDLYILEEDWRNIVENWDRLTEKRQQQQTALWELAQTEAAYIKTLKVVTDLFMACLCSLQASNILNEVDRTKLFSNIPDIYSANRFFWAEHILRMVNAARTTHSPLDPGHLLHGFETFEQIFLPYTRYCSEQSKCQQYCRDRLNDNELFTAYLVWCETQKDCNRLRLLDILVKPMQRLTKYSLLLKAIHKNTEDEEQRDELTIMIKCVDNFVASVNAALRRVEEIARLASAAIRLEYYDVVESRDEELDKMVKLYSSLDITSAPMPGCAKDTLRTLLREGDLKLRDAATSKTEVHVFLLTDMLLLCKPCTKKGSAASASGSGLKIIRQPYVIDRLRVSELKESSSLAFVYLNEFGVASAAFILTASEPKLAKLWMESVRKAQQQFAVMKIPPLGDIQTVATVSRQASTYLGDGDFEMEDSEALSRTPRGSSRASRVSSLAHSHSGSMEMEGASPGSTFLPSYNTTRNVSVDNEPPRASSVSSEEGGEVGHNHRPIQIRRSLLSKSPTPNTLSVQVPAYSCLGQSLPNLTLATSPQTSTVSPTPPNSLLIVPQITKSKDTLLSPGHRGISYPPPSPPRGALRRAFAIPQSRNPPLIKTRHVNASVASSQSPVPATMSFDTEAIEERRRRLESVQRAPSLGNSVKEERRHDENR